MTGDVLLDTTVAVAHLRGVVAVSQRLAEAQVCYLPTVAPIPENDLWIAAIAFERGLPLATRDEHFAHVPGLTVLDWR